MSLKAKAIAVATEARDTWTYFVSVFRAPTRRSHFTLKTFAIMVGALCCFIVGLRLQESAWSLVPMFFGGACLGLTTGILKRAHDEDDAECMRAHAAKVEALDERFKLAAEQYDKGMHVGASIVAEVAGLPAIPPPREWGRRP